MLQSIQSQPTQQLRRPAARPHPRAAGTAPAQGDRLLLSYGAHDTNGTGPIRRLQGQLQQLGYFQTSYGATGGYYAVTREAVKAFQADHNLPATGRADAATLAALEVAANGAPAPAPAPPCRSPGVLGNLSPAQLAALGRSDKPAFFEALRPAAEEVERRTGVPAAVTMGQAALETGFGSHIPAAHSYNLFGHKGVGTAGSVRQSSFEDHRSHREVSAFRCYHNFYEAVVDHGSIYESGYYRRAMAQVAAGNRDPRTFLKNIEGIYHNDGREYTDAVMSIIHRYGLAEG